MLFYSILLSCGMRPSTVYRILPLKNNQLGNYLTPHQLNRHLNRFSRDKEFCFDEICAISPFGSGGDPIPAKKSARLSSPPFVFTVIHISPPRLYADTLDVKTSAFNLPETTSRSRTLRSLRYLGCKFSSTWPQESMMRSAE